MEIHRSYKILDSPEIAVIQNRKEENLSLNITCDSMHNKGIVITTVNKDSRGLTFFLNRK